jgi:hypothetical protein
LRAGDTPTILSGRARILRDVGQIQSDELVVGGCWLSNIAHGGSMSRGQRPPSKACLDTRTYSHRTSPPLPNGSGVIRTVDSI